MNTYGGEYTRDKWIVWTRIQESISSSFNFQGAIRSTPPPAKAMLSPKTKMTSTDANPRRCRGICVGWLSRDTATRRGFDSIPEMSSPKGAPHYGRKARRVMVPKRKISVLFQGCPFISSHTVRMSANRAGQVIKLRRRDKMDTFVKHLIISTGETKTAPAMVAREK